MKYLRKQRPSKISWKEKLLVYITTLLICILAANFKVAIQKVTGNAHTQDVNISTLSD
ncbi:hypothetical protein QWY93_09280 [Echinicola jeungdonensis]|uniref:Uncharacterized protein n=1 Tax=Echinicola jeungdonensis TaxID=709343 RepID=A0ABV5J4Y1_9BACT|nr:hypothetical protein [Echinicola jeungdonensis]MDN3669523.1 hypothetical protein [Echinicola jeungdonensis]